MALKFDPNIPGFIEAEVVGSVEVIEPGNPTPFGNLVVDPSKAFQLKVSWHVFGFLTNLWLTALEAGGAEWVVTAYADPAGPGTRAPLGSTTVPVGAAPFSGDETFEAIIDVPANVLAEENPGVPSPSGVYRTTVTFFLNSSIGAPGYDIAGFAEGPTIKAENPL